MKVYVIGGANIDITGKATKQMILKDSNPGSISFAFGGVARNVAENLARLNHKPVFISAFSDDFFGHAMLKQLKDLGADVSLSLVVKSATTSTYLALLNKDNDMEIAVSDTAILSHLTPKYLQPIISRIKETDIVVLDTNLESKTLEYIFRNCKAKIFVDPISTTKAVKLKPFLKYIYGIKPNIFEAEVLTGFKLSTKKEIIKAANKLQQLGIKKVFISLGKMGAYGLNSNESKFISTGSISIKSATGAGDSFMAGIVDSEVNQRDLIETLKFATGCSIITLQSLKTVSDKISQSNVKKQIKRSLRL